MYQIEQLPEGTIVFTSANHRFGTDSLLLAQFCKVKPNWSACDLGSGCGILLLSLIDKGLKGRATAIELDQEGALLIEKAKTENHLPQLEMIQGDLCTYRTGKPYDIIISNPPYFNNGPESTNIQRANARHEKNCTLEEVIKTASHLLKDGGSFCLCYPPNRMAELFILLQKNNLAPKRLQFIRKSSTHEPWLLLVDARKNGGTGVSILPDKILHVGTPLIY